MVTLASLAAALMLVTVLMPPGLHAQDKGAQTKGGAAPAAAAAVAEVPVTASISGTATDGERKAIAGAKVQVRNAAGEIRRGETDAEGKYKIEGLAPGMYDVAILRSGFQTKVVTTYIGGDAKLNLPLDAESMYDLTHYHMLLNHFPTVGLILGLGLMIAAVISNSRELKRAALVVFVLIALASILTYVTGNAAYEKIQSRSDVSKTLARTHEGAALGALAVMELTGMAAWLGLWGFRRTDRFSSVNLVAVLLLAVVSFGLMARAANIGGEIRHPEIRIEQETTTMEAALGRTVGLWVTGERWVWPACEALHFIGLTLLIGVCLLIDLRMLGVMKGVAFSSLHRLLPWGVVGFAINTMTGMLFFVGSPEQYTKNISFHWKLVLLMLAGLNALYFTIMDEPWELRAGEDAPALTKALAGSVLVLWVAVMYFGSMLPFIGNAF